MDITYITNKPQNLTEKEKQYFLKLLLIQGQVENPTLEKINSCPFLCLAFDRALPIGIGALKDIYKTPFEKADVVHLQEKYNLELGYLFVVDKKKYRGKKLAQAICSELLNKIKPENVFATTEENNENAMKWILQKYGFKKAGQTYIGAKTKKNIGLYLLANTDSSTSPQS